MVSGGNVSFLPINKYDNDFHSIEVRVALLLATVCFIIQGKEGGGIGAQARVLMRLRSWVRLPVWSEIIQSSN